MFCSGVEGEAWRVRADESVTEEVQVPHCTFRFRLGLESREKSEESRQKSAFDSAPSVRISP